MRKTGIDQTITRDDVKVGDKIRITREVTVKSVRPANLGNAGPSVIIEATIGATQERDSLALTRKEAVTLLERDLSLDFGDEAKVVTWRVKEFAGFKQRFAIREEGGRSWISDDEDTYSGNAELEGDILDDQFGEYIEGTFEVLFPKPKPKLASGGYVHNGSGWVGKDPHPYINLGSGSIQNLAQQLSQRVALGSKTP